MGDVTQARTRYHHGDLANALAAAALECAREGGPDAVVLRAVARRVGVSATAAYRHFARHDDLIETVKQQCQLELVQRMETALAAAAPDPDPRREAIRRLRALGVGYLRFAIEEPGLFRTAFCHHGEPVAPDWERMLTAPGFVALTTVLDDLAATGAMDQSHRAGAEMFAWSTVHGLSMLTLDGPLGTLSPAELAPITDRILDAVVAGILGYEP
jgi:AcrR family transcriptional regulator